MFSYFFTQTLSGREVMITCWGVLFLRICFDPPSDCRFQLSNTPFVCPFFYIEKPQKLVLIGPHFPCLKCFSFSLLFFLGPLPSNLGYKPTSFFSPCPGFYPPTEDPHLANPWISFCLKHCFPPLVSPCDASCFSPTRVLASPLLMRFPR